jgi:hypothetical protein
MEKNINEFVRQLSWKIESYQKRLERATESLKSKMNNNNLYMVDTRDVEEIKVCQQVLEELINQKQAFEFYFVKDAE